MCENILYTLQTKCVQFFRWHHSYIGVNIIHMKFITIIKDGRVKKISGYAWENFMPHDKDGWSIKPEEPKELKKEELKVIVNSNKNNNQNFNKNKK
jgi:hypothetical protein